jgi:hypothetical protein
MAKPDPNLDRGDQREQPYRAGGCDSEDVRWRIRSEMRTTRTAAAAIVGVLALSGCAGSGLKQTTHSTTSSATTSSPVSLASPQMQQIQLARASKQVFSIFPAMPRTTTCLIPAGGPTTRRLHGTCQTSIHSHRHTHEPAIIVTFTESWVRPVRCPPGAECVNLPLHHAWTVIEGEPIASTRASLHVVATHSSGAPAPQFIG